MGRRHGLRWLAFSLAAAAGPALGAGAELEAWAKARAAEHRGYLDQLAARASPDGTALWRERSPTDPPLPGFVPPTSLAPLARAVRGGVVNISTESGARASKAAPRRSLGSGFLLSPDGYVVTNHHVIARAQHIRVTLADGRELVADVVGLDPSTDVALLKIRGKARDLPFNHLGDSDLLEVGDWVVAIGNPFGLDHSVSHGMISAKERVIGVGVFDDFIQTDALINPGNSGGPLFNMRGEVVGVTTAIVHQGQGIGFAVPINMVKDLLPNLLVNGRLSRGWLGVEIQEGGPAEERGAVVRRVYGGSPAEQAGLREGDRVIAANGRPIESYLQLLRRVAILAPGTAVRLTVSRGEKPEEVTVKLAERPAPEALSALQGPGFAQPFGLSVRDVSPEVARTLGVEPGAGVWVAGVVPGSSGEQAGLRPGDVIVEVNRMPVKDVRSFRSALERSGAGDALIQYQRGEETRIVAVEPD